MRGLPAHFVLRPVEDGDASSLQALVADCFAEYDGVQFDADGLDSDLKSWASYLENDGGTGWVVEDKSRSNEVIACVGVTQIDDTFYELKRLYLKKSYRGARVAVVLLDLVERYALKAGADALLLWSDSRFERAHSFYRREGFRKMEETRDLGDISNTTELKFIKGL